MSTTTELIVSLEEPLLDVDQAAALLNVRPSWVRHATRGGALPAIRVGKHMRYTRPMLEAWAASRRAALLELQRQSHRLPAPAKPAERRTLK